MMLVIRKLYDMFGNICYFCSLGQRVAVCWSPRSSTKTARLWAKQPSGQAGGLPSEEAKGSSQKEVADESIWQQMKTDCWKTLSVKKGKRRAAIRGAAEANGCLCKESPTFVGMLKEPTEGVGVESRAVGTFRFQR